MIHISDETKGKHDNIEIRVFNHTTNEVGYKKITESEIQELFRHIQIEMNKI